MSFLERAKHAAADAAEETRRRAEAAAAVARERSQSVADVAREKGQAAAEVARERGQAAAAVLGDPATAEATQRQLAAAGQQAKKGLGLARKGLSTAIDRIDPGILADIVIKATALQERANASLREKHSLYRISEISIAASIPPQVNFAIGRIDDPTETPDGSEVASSELVSGDDGPMTTEVVALDGTTVELAEPEEAASGS